MVSANANPMDIKYVIVVAFGVAGVLVFLVNTLAKHWRLKIIRKSEQKLAILDRELELLKSEGGWARECAVFEREKYLLGVAVEKGGVRGDAFVKLVATIQNKSYEVREGAVEGGAGGASAASDASDASRESANLLSRDRNVSLRSVGPEVFRG
jgi:hypothetical protein